MIKEFNEPVNLAENLTSQAVLLGLSFALIDVNGEDLVSGTITDLVEWLRGEKLFAKHLLDSLKQDENWEHRDDVVALQISFNEGEICTMVPELTRGFLAQVVFSHK